MKDMENLTGLKKGDIIRAKVKAFNNSCSSLLGPANTSGQHLITCPKAMEPVFYSERQYKWSISIYWKTLNAEQLGGAGARTTEFELQWKKTAKGQKVNDE